MENKIAIYNSIEEISIRIIILINSGSTNLFSLDQLVVLDHLNLYRTEIDSKTLHPSYELEELELYSHRPRIKSSLLYLISKDLLDVIFDEKGIRYTANLNTLWCVNQLQGIYTIKLKEYSDECISKYGKYPVENLEQIASRKEE